MSEINLSDDDDDDRKSTMRFPISLRWTSYVAPVPQRGLKMQNGRF